MFVNGVYIVIVKGLIVCVVIFLVDVVVELLFNWDWGWVFKGL